MVGETGDLMFDKVRPYLKTPSQFWGVDLRGLFLLQHAWGGSGMTLSKGDILETAKLAQSSPNPIGTLNLDTHSAASGAWWKGNAHSLLEVVKKGVSRDNGFCLILNHDLSRNGRYDLDLQQRVNQHLECLSTTFRAWRGLGGIKMGLEPMYEPGFLGRAGVCDVYRNSKVSDRMLTLRLYFEKATVAFDMQGVSQVNEV